MLSIKERQHHLDYIGLYKGKIDGKEGKATKSAYLQLQKKYFNRKSDQDGKYGRNTDILLVNAYRVKRYTKNFKLSEFKCECNGKYCTGYPEYLSIQLLKNLQAMRNHFKAPITITCGERCKKYNAQLNGSIAKSKHVDGKALDVYVKGVTDTESGRIKVMNYWKKLQKFGYTYCYLPTRYSTYQQRHATYMGNAVHVDVSK